MAGSSALPIPKTQPDAWLNPAVATHSPHSSSFAYVSVSDRNQVREGMPIRPRSRTGILGWR